MVTTKYWQFERTYEIQNRQFILVTGGHTSTLSLNLCTKIQTASVIVFTYLEDWHFFLLLKYLQDRKVILLFFKFTTHKSLIVFDVLKDSSLNRQPWLHNTNWHLLHIKKIDILKVQNCEFPFLGPIVFHVRHNPVSPHGLPVGIGT